MNDKYQLLIVILIAIGIGGVVSIGTVVVLNEYGCKMPLLESMCKSPSIWNDIQWIKLVVLMLIAVAIGLPTNWLIANKVLDHLETEQSS